MAALGKDLPGIAGKIRPSGQAVVFIDMLAALLHVTRHKPNALVT